MITRQVARDTIDRFARAALILCVLLLPCAVFAKQTVKPEWKNIDLKGEVVDSWCFASRSVGMGRGKDHEACAKACAHGGVTLGIVDDDGKMFIAAKSKGYSGCQMLLEPYVAKRVHIHGMVAEIGGCPILKINTVEELGADDKPLRREYHVPSKQSAKWITPKQQSK